MFFFQSYPNYGFGNKKTRVTIWGYTNKREVIYEAEHTNNHPFDLITPLLPKNKYRITPYKSKLKGEYTNIFPLPESLDVMYNSKYFASVPSDHEVTVLLRSNLRWGPNYNGYWYLIYDEKYDISGWIWSGKLEKE
jgi:hypothetical protein